MKNPLKKVFLFLFWFYGAAISPHKGGAHCRFYPSCSVYGREAVEKYGVFRGLYLALRRLLKCHPFHPGAYDPVP
jgi:putative membrane protein insertion efficiency factor